MNAAVLLGLSAAFLYGITDYLARIAGRAVGVWRSLLYGDLLAFAMLSIWLFRSADAPPGVAAHPLAWAVSIGSGFVLLAAGALLTQALTRGTLAVVAPVTASYGAIAAILSAAAGERLPLHAAAGIAVTMTGVCGVSIPAGGLRELKTHLHASGFGWALGAAICYGVGFWMQGVFAIPVLGAIVPVWLSYLIAVLVVPLFGLSLRLSLAPPTRAQLPAVLGAGIGSATANIALTLGLATHRVAIVVVLSTLASAVTVLMSRYLDRALIARHQWTALAVIIAGLVLIKS